MAVLGALRISEESGLLLHELDRLVPLDSDVLVRRLLELVRVGWVSLWRSYVRNFDENDRPWVDCEGFLFVLLDEGVELAEAIMRLEELSCDPHGRAESKRQEVVEIIEQRDPRRFREPFRLSSTGSV